tara:strand:+ start:359 stop:535 length:177 start_codon:yes stop_codon:yes gene_type:complete
MKKDRAKIRLGIILGLSLYFVGAINFQEPLSYILIFSIGIIIIFPVFNIIRRKIKKNK